MQLPRDDYGTYEVREFDVKSALTLCAMPGQPWSLNPYTGCSHACAYCYVPDVAHVERPRWGTYVLVKRNLPTVLSHEMHRKERRDVFLSSATDPYQPVEGTHQITRKCLEILVRHDWPLSVLTRNPLVRRDALLLRQFSEVSVGMSVPTMDDELRRLVEPGAPTIEARLRTLRALADEGLDTYANLMPTYPLTGGASPDDIARAFRDAGVKTVSAGAWRYLDTVVPVMRERLAGTPYEGVIATIQNAGYWHRTFRALERAFERAGVELRVVYPQPERRFAPMDWGERERAGLTSATVPRASSIRRMAATSSETVTNATPLYRKPLSLGMLLLVATALAIAIPSVLSGRTTPAPPPTAFSTPLYIDAAHHAGEPGLRVDNAGRIFVDAPSSLSRGHQGWLWRSTDGGASFTFIQNAPGLRATTEVGGGDSDLTVTPGGRVYYVDLWLGDISFARSEDGGLTWLQSTPVTSLIPSNDRQWLGTYGENVIYLAYNQIPYGPTVSKSVDAGITWTTVPAVGTDQSTGFIGNILVDPLDGSAHLFYQVCDPTCSNEIWQTTSTDGGLTWTRNLVYHTNGNVANLFSVGAMDGARNLYVTWSEQDPLTLGTKVYVTSSTDHGATWSAPVAVSGTLGNAVMPWIVAGADGKVDVAFYGTSAGGDASVQPASTAWYVYFAQSTNAHAAAPTWSLTPTSAQPNHYGNICNQGTLCDTIGGDRSLLDYFQVVLDSKGFANIIYADNHELAPKSSPYVTYVRQTGGVSLNG